MTARAAVAILVALLAAITAHASETGLSGADGHPRQRFPLALFAPATGDASLDAAVDGALRDWNAVARETLGIDVFARVPHEHGAAVVVTFVTTGERGLMGRAAVSATDHVIDVPVRVDVVAPEARGATSRELLLYQVLAHELGHALGLPHVADAASIMCCVPGRVDLHDPATRAAYVAARRNPDLRSVRGQLGAHYARVWR